MAVDAATAAVLPWANAVFYGGFVGLLVVHTQYGGSSNKLISITEEKGGWSSGYFKLFRWIVGLVMASGACCAGIVWIFADKQFAGDEGRLFAETLASNDTAGEPESLTPQMEEEARDIYINIGAFGLASHFSPPLLTVPAVVSRGS